MADISGIITDNTNNTENKTPDASVPEINYAQLAAELAKAVDKGKEQKEKVITKSFLEQYNLTEDMAKEAVRAYKDLQTKNKPDIKAITNELNTYKTQLQQAKLNNLATLTALELGIDIKKASLILKMADLTKVTNENGEVDAEKIKASINEVLTALPELKGVTNNKGTKIVELGGGKDEKEIDTDDDKLRKAFGLKPKK